MVYSFICDIRVIRGSFIWWPQETQQGTKVSISSLFVFLWLSFDQRTFCFSFFTPPSLCVSLCINSIFATTIYYSSHSNFSSFPFFASKINPQNSSCQVTLTRVIVRSSLNRLWLYRWCISCTLRIAISPVGCTQCTIRPQLDLWQLERHETSRTRMDYSPQTLVVCLRNIARNRKITPK